MNNFFVLFGIISTVLVSLWAVLKYLILGSYKIDNDTGKRLIETIESSAKFKWLLTNECVTEPRYPDVYEALVLLNGAVFFINRNERLLTAGWKGKEETTHVTFPRWYRKKVLDILRSKVLNLNTIPVMAPPHTARTGWVS